MKILIHFKKQQLEKFLSLLVKVNEDYINKNFELKDNLKTLFDDIQTYYQQIGDSTNESNISQLKIYFETSLFGIDPVKLEKIKVGRRIIVNKSAFHCLSELNIILGESHQIAIGILKTSSEAISQIIFSAIQSKLLNNKDLISSDSIEKIEKLWKSLTSNEQVALLDKRLKLEILPQDIYFILDDMFEKIRMENNND